MSGVDDWIEYRRPADRELLGWIRLLGDTCTIVDLLGREEPTPRDWVQAEEALAERGLGWLAEPYELVQLTTPGAEPLPVRIVGVSRDRAQGRGLRRHHGRGTHRPAAVPCTRRTLPADGDSGAVDRPDRALSNNLRWAAPPEAPSAN